MGLRKGKGTNFLKFLVLGQCVVSSPTIPINLATQMASADRGGQGLSIFPLVDPIWQKKTNAEAAAYAMHGR